jgi:hypothetical protein
MALLCLQNGGIQHKKTFGYIINIYCKISKMDKVYDDLKY